MWVFRWSIRCCLVADSCIWHSGTGQGVLRRHLPGDDKFVGEDCGRGLALYCMSIGQFVCSGCVFRMCDSYVMGELKNLGLFGRQWQQMMNRWD